MEDKMYRHGSIDEETTTKESLSSLAKEIKDLQNYDNYDLGFIILKKKQQEMVQRYQTVQKGERKL